MLIHLGIGSIAANRIQRTAEEDRLTACLELLTEEEAIRYLRLDTIAGLTRPQDTLARYRA